jgi:hypothetical protein
MRDRLLTLGVVLARSALAAAVVAVCLAGGVACPGGEDADGDGVTVDAGDCNDQDPNTYPGAAEICDARDNDCDGAIPDDELDADGDGFIGCLGDCDDTQAGVHPGADELCNGVDDDCDGSLEEEDDQDGDGLAECDGDCDDGDPWVNPEAADECGGGDTDCDGDPDTHRGGPCISCSHRIPGDFDTITEAVDGAAAGDAICVEPGTYPESGIDLGDKGLQLAVSPARAPRPSTVSRAARSCCSKAAKAPMPSRRGSPSGADPRSGVAGSSSTRRHSPCATWW